MVQSQHRAASAKPATADCLDPSRFRPFQWRMVRQKALGLRLALSLLVGLEMNKVDCKSR
jgi:hypothetical protein